MSCHNRTKIKFYFDFCASAHRLTYSGVNWMNCVDTNLAALDMYLYYDT